MKVIIAGSRNIIDYGVHYVIEAVKESGFKITEEVCGMARGIDWCGKIWAEANEIPVKKFPANWKRYGKAAGPIRNKEMMEYADALIAIWDEKSRGTLDMINQMRAANKPVYVKIIKGTNKNG
jgi:hypothetical protein